MLRNFAAVAATVALALVALPAGAATLSLNIVGAESACSGWTPGTNGSVLNPVLTLTCIPAAAATPGTTPGVCTINGSTGPSLTGTIGTPVALTANCPGATGYAWTSVGGSCADSTAQTCQASATTQGGVTYTVKGTNGSLVGPGTNAGIIWSPPSSAPPPPSSGSISCSSSGFQNTIVMDMPWTSTDSASRLITSGFDGSTALVIRFTVPAGYSSDQLARISGVEYGGGPVTRYSTLSSQPCDFAATSTLPPQNVEMDTGISAFWLQVGGSSTRFVVVQPGQTYFLNVRNTDSQGRPSCTSQAYCNMAFGMTVP